MSSGITLTAATRQNLLSLQGTADLLTQTQNRLSTGKKVNSALDDPTSFFTSQSLTGRSGDLGSLLNGISNGVQTIQAANQGITSIQKLVDSAKSTANQALADKSAVTSGLAATAATVSGSKSFQGLAGTADGTQDFSSVAKDGSLDISLDGGKTKTTIRLDSSTLANNSSDLTKVSAGQLVTAINSQISNSSALKGKVSASVGGDGRINFATTSSGATQQLSVSGATSSTLDIGFGKASSTTNAKVAASAAFGTPTFSATAGSFLSVGDGNVTTSLAVNSTTLKADGTAVGVAPSADDVVDAYNVQLKAGGSTVSAFNNAGTIEFRAQDVGPTGVVTVSVAAPPSGSTQVTAGFGTTTGASSGTFTAAPAQPPPVCLPRAPMPRTVRLRLSSTDRLRLPMRRVDRPQPPAASIFPVPRTVRSRSSSVPARRRRSRSMQPRSWRPAVQLLSLAETASLRRSTRRSLLIPVWLATSLRASMPTTSWF
jgi:flagellin-like hook-associated protein FlgL